MSTVVVEALHGDGMLLLDTASGRTAPAPADAKKRGSVTQLKGHTFALYAEGGVLYFQWDERRWPFAADAVHVRYGHDLQRKTSAFSVNERHIEYPAWWADDPHHEPLVPELDPDYDDLAWFAALKREPERLAALLERWSAVA